jgi:hypothetical protein
MLKHAAIFYFVLFGWALHASAQGFYTTAIAINPGIIQPGFNLAFYFEPGAPVQGYGYHTYSIDSNLKLAFHFATLGGGRGQFFGRQRWGCVG